MKLKFTFLLLSAVLAFFPAKAIFAQGTAFTYQGRLNDNGNPATGKYDFQFAIYDSSSGGTLIAGPVTASAVVVSNGLFVVNLDFGSGVFTGPARWLNIGVRTNGSTGAFTTLSPRQPLLPAPYAIFANTAGNLSGTLPASQLGGTLPASAFAGYTNTVALTNNGNLFAGTFGGSFAGAFNGNGGNVTNVNVAHLAGVLADNQLPSNTAFVNSNQTFSANNYFTGANTFTNLYGNSFSGSFFGNGLVGWIPTNGTTVQGQIDHGYLLTNSQLVTVTLPASAHPGDIVRISGASDRGWVVTESSGQSIFGNFASYSNSSPVMIPDSSTLNSYSDVAAAWDGSRLYAVGSGFPGVLFSSNSGLTWNPAGTLAPYCQSVACSANGRIVYVVTTSGVVYKSTNSGATWTQIASGATTISCTADGSQYFTGNVVCSGNGTCRARFTSSSILISVNSGGSYSISVPVPASNLSCLAVSGDCSRLVAGTSNGLLYGSANSGATWSAITTSNQVWSGVWMSEDGSRFAGAVKTYGSTKGGIYNYAVHAMPGTVSTNSTISGSQGTAVELQCTGYKRWMPVSSSGRIWAY